MQDGSSGHKVRLSGQKIQALLYWIIVIDWTDHTKYQVDRMKISTIGGGTPIPCAKLSSRCLPVGWVGCTLFGGLESMLIRIVFKTDGLAVVWKSSHDRPGT